MQKSVRRQRDGLVLGDTISKYTLLPGELQQGPGAILALRGTRLYLETIHTMRPPHNTMTILHDRRVIRFFQEHADHGTGGPGPAVFDCDGTVIRGDVGEAMLYYQLEEFCFKVSPADVWEDYPDRKELDRLFRTLAGEPGRGADHPLFGMFADLVLTWYFGQIDDGRVEKACADIVRLLAGHTIPEVRAIADATFQRELAAPLGKRRLGSRTPPRGLRYLKESRQLVGELKTRGFDLWAVSGSNRWSVEPVFRGLGIPPDHVIGIDLELRDGLLTSSVKEPIPIRAKKIDALKAFVSKRPLIVASDSRNDIPLLQYSSDLKVFVSSRRKDWTIFFTGGNVQRDDSWLIIESPTTEG
jgi:phosphoserine phosphatase